MDNVGTNIRHFSLHYRNLYKFVHTIRTKLPSYFLPARSRVGINIRTMHYRIAPSKK